jgi:hypothetical protein
MWLLLRALALVSAPHPDWPIEKRRISGIDCRGYG